MISTFALCRALPIFARRLLHPKGKKTQFDRIQIAGVQPAEFGVLLERWPKE